MNVISKVSLTENVSVVSFNKANASIHFLSTLFSEISYAKINVDMISQTSPIGAYNSVAFTVDDKDVTKVLELLKGNDHVPLVSSGNVKISLYGESMPTKIGVAALVFDILKRNEIDILLITTSDVDISIVVAAANVQAFELLGGKYE